MSTIYRKYRPQVFSDITGQDHVVKTLANEIAADKVAHAYLFSGPRGTGKTTMARLLAKAVNCAARKEGQNEPCNQCSSCAEIASGRNIDVIEIDAASHTGVDNVRENIIENARFKPTQSKYKIFIIDEVHMLSVSAFNALLKTLEEPPSHVIFILATTEPHKLLATIISRCQKFNFKKVGYDNMLKRLESICKQEEIKVDKKVLEKIINKSDGCVRDAESLLGQIFSLNLKNIGEKDAEIVLPSSNIESILRFLESIVEKEPKSAMELIGALAQEGVNLEQFAHDTIEALRAVMLKQIGSDAGGGDYSKDNQKTIKQLAEKIAGDRLILMLESLISRKREIKSAPIPQLPLELFAAEFAIKDCHTDNGASDCHSRHAYRQAGESGNPVGDCLDSPFQGNDRQEPLAPPLTTKNPEDKKHEHHIAQTIKDTISHLTRKEIKTTLDQIKERREEIIDKITQNNHSLGFILKMSEISSLENGELKLSVPYSFHKDKLEEGKTKKAVEQCLFDIFGEKILLACEVTNLAEVQDKELNNLAADFGGEIIN